MPLSAQELKFAACAAGEAGPKRSCGRPNKAIPADAGPLRCDPRHRVAETSPEPRHGPGRYLPEFGRRKEPGALQIEARPTESIDLVAILATSVHHYDVQERRLLDRITACPSDLRISPSACARLTTSPWPSGRWRRDCRSTAP